MEDNYSSQSNQKTFLTDTFKTSEAFKRMLNWDFKTPEYLLPRNTGEKVIYSVTKIVAF